MVERSRTVRGFEVPAFLYGTAWKEERTAELVTTALEAGFRGIDTANQRKHYFEQGVGDALATAFEDGVVTRDEVFVQTKFTYARGQDHRLPYDPKLPPAQQVEQSFQRSLEHLRLERIDSLVLHGPSQPRGLGDADREVWKAMESMQDAGLVRLLGVSNISPEQLESLVELATRTPAFVQNRCFAQRGWDALVRRICDQHDIVYQGFSLLTANQHVLGHPKVQAIAEHHGKTIPQVIFRFAMQLGMIPLTGTTDPAHMREDLGAFDFSLAEEEVNLIAEAGL